MTNRQLLPVGDLRVLARRALAFGYAALDRPTPKKVRDARNLIVRVLGTLDDQLTGGEVRELALALKRMAAQLSGYEDKLAMT
jgi:hypothetical protein